MLIPLFKINLPGNAGAFFNYLMQIAAFDVVPTDDIFTAVFMTDAPDALNDNFETVGFETTQFMYNLGSLAFALASFPILALIALVLNLFKNNAAAIIRARKIEKGIYWNSTIRVILESYTINHLMIKAIQICKV